MIVSDYRLQMTFFEKVMSLMKCHHQYKSSLKKELCVMKSSLLEIDVKYKKSKHKLINQPLLSPNIDFLNNIS